MSDVGEPTSGLAKVRAGQGQGQSPQLLYLPYAGRCSEFLSEKGLPWLCPCWGARTGLFPEYGIHGSESDSWHLSGVGSQTPSFGVLNIGMLDLKYQVLGYQALGTMSGVLGMGGHLCEPASLPSALEPRVCEFHAGHSGVSAPCTQ